MKLFLLYAENKDRVAAINETKLVDPGMKTAFYKPQTVHLHYRINKADFYNLIVSTFKLNMSSGGVLTFESD